MRETGRIVIAISDFSVIFSELISPPRERGKRLMQLPIVAHAPLVTAHASSGKHWGLVFVMSALLPLDCLPPSPIKGHLPFKTIGEACHQPAQAHTQVLILYAYKQFQLGHQAADLFAKQQPVIAR
jgi:hypothetical protein